jgi:hypothetical protein
MAICSSLFVWSETVLKLRNMKMMVSSIRLSQIPQVFPVAGDAP